MSYHASKAYVLSGGASIGAVQVGMLRALYEPGMAPDVIVGTPAGALNYPNAHAHHDPRGRKTRDARVANWVPCPFTSV